MNRYPIALALLVEEKNRLLRDHIPGQPKGGPCKDCARLQATLDEIAALTKETRR